MLKTCGQLAATCGKISAGCGTEIDCGGCPPGMLCGGDGVANQCGSAADADVDGDAADGPVTPTAECTAGLQSFTQACRTCVVANCVEDCNACSVYPACIDAAKCTTSSCAGLAPLQLVACIQGCQPQNDPDAKNAFGDIGDCMGQHCLGDCYQ